MIKKFAIAYGAYIRRSLKNYTLQSLGLVTALIFADSVFGLYMPWIGLLALLFAIIQFIFLLRPHMYTFTFSKSNLLYFRIATAACIIIGLVGTILNWSAIQPVIDWINS
jgi:hypothetical protein